ncbi:hypothetical protein [Xenorhabdus sp. SGI246]|uniref:hypothetical protein n=1 Tax=Xenorhabdus sp. SGI246 TaxID=3158263 RepID=UPI00349F172A
MGSLNYTDNILFYQTISSSVTRADVIDFLEQVAKQGDKRLTFLVLDNTRIHHGIEEKIRNADYESTICFYFIFPTTARS